MWLLSAWDRVTGMAQWEKGVTTAMSLGGKAARIARSIDLTTLSQPWGLGYLVYRLECDLGSESQERQRAALDNFTAYQRGKGASYIDHVMNFELLLDEAIKAGAQWNDVMKSDKLLKSARLSSDEERWVLQPVAGDLSRYNEIRAALRRLPWKSENTQRHHNGELYPISSSAHTAVQDPTPFNLQHQQLHQPPVAFQGSSVSFPAQPSDNTGEEYYLAGESSEDDFLSSNSEAGSDEAQTWGSAWAVHLRGKSRFKKSNKGKGKGIEQRKANTAGLDPKRNFNEEPPKGISKQEWEKRFPCPGCGSRWHRDCQGKGSGGKGGKRQGHTARTMLGSFLLLAATAQSVLVPDTSADLFSFCGLEPFEGREARFEALYSGNGKIRYGLIVDTGAEDNACGSKWIDAYIRDVIVPCGLSDQIYCQDQSVAYSGVGEGSAISDTKTKFPIGLQGMMAEFCATVFEGQFFQNSSFIWLGIIGMPQNYS